MTIEAYTGLPGMGKTYLMTRLALKKMSKGKTVYANYPLVGAEKYNQVQEVFAVKDAIILIDEAGLVAPAGFWKNIPFEIMAHWRQHRHNGVDVWYTTQDLRDVATPLRRVTQFVNHVKKLGPFFIWRCVEPRSGEKFGGGLHLFDKEIAKKYDTHAEFISKQEYLKNC